MRTPPEPVTTAGLFAGPHRRVVIALLALVAIASYNNLSVAAVLPEIGDDLGDIDLLPFVITVELLTNAVAVLAAGPLVDGLGSRRTFRIAGIGFALTSVLVAVAPSMPTLIGARAVQGVFAGMVTTVAVASIGIAIPDRLRPRAFASVSAVWGVMGVAGPAIAAVVVAVADWRAIFAINVPVAVVALALGWSQLPDRDPSNPTTRPDLVGIALIAVITSGALALTAADLRAGALGGIAALGAALAYRRWASHRPDPVVRLPHLGQRRYLSVHLVATAVLAGGVGANSFLPLYVRGVRDGSETLAAFSVMFFTVGWSCNAWVASRLQDRHPGERVVTWGASLAAPAAIGATVAVAVDAPLAVVYGAFTLLGAGVGMVTSTSAVVLQSRTDAREMGRLNGAHQFVRTIAITLGIAALAAITFAVVDRRTGDVEQVRDLLGDDGAAPSADVLDALADGYTLALAVSAGVVALAVPAAHGLVRSRDDRVASEP